MKKIFKGATQIISYRMGADLTQPYDKFSCFLDKGVMECTQDRVTNYGPDNSIMSRVLFKVPAKKLDYDKWRAEIDGACSKC